MAEHPVESAPFGHVSTAKQATFQVAQRFVRRRGIGGALSLVWLLYGVKVKLLMITSLSCSSMGAAPLFNQRLIRTFSLPGGGLSSPP